jgi:hypothetical protein
MWRKLSVIFTINLGPFGEKCFEFIAHLRVSIIIKIRFYILNSGEYNLNKIRLYFSLFPVVLSEENADNLYIFNIIPVFV